MRHTTLLNAGHRGRAFRTPIITLSLLLIAATIASAHDLFLKPVRFFVAENTEVLVRVLNGTFTKSENSIARSRLRDVSIVSPAGREQLDTAAWSVQGDTSTFRVRTASAGTYVLGASTNPSFIALEAKDFNEYLRSDGLPDVLEARRTSGELQQPARERYAKHVKALIQVGETRSDHYATELGYPAEIVPLDNPYAVRPGASLRFRTMVDGAPAPNQYLLYGGRLPNGNRMPQRSVRSDSAGVARIALRTRGTWYIKFISMARPQSDTVDYESKWATLTFQVR